MTNDGRVPANRLFRTFYRDLELRDFDITNGEIFDQGIVQRNKELMKLTTDILNNIYWSDYNVELDKLNLQLRKNEK